MSIGRTASGYRGRAARLGRYRRPCESGGPRHPLEPRCPGFPRSRERRDEMGSESSPQAALDELREGAGAVADAVLFRRVHFAKRQGSTERDEDRVVAKPPITTRRPDQPTLDLAAEQLSLLAWPRQGKNGNK